MNEIANKEQPFESFLDYGGSFFLNTYSKTEYALNYYSSSKYSFKLGLEIRNILANENKIAFMVNFSFPGKYETKILFDFSKIVYQLPKLLGQNLEFADNLIVFEYDNYEKLFENLLSALKFCKTRIFHLILKTKIDNLKKVDFRVSEEFDGKKIKIKFDTYDVYIVFSEKPEFNNFIDKIEAIPEIYEFYLKSVCTKLNFEIAEQNHRYELEFHFAKTFEILYLKKHCDLERKRNIAKGIDIFEETLTFHLNRYRTNGGSMENIKLEFDIEMNEQNDEIPKFKIHIIKKMKKNDIRELSLKVRGGTIFLVDNLRTRETPINDLRVLFDEIKEIYDRFT